MLEPVIQNKSADPESLKSVLTVSESILSDENRNTLQSFAMRVGSSPDSSGERRTFFPSLTKEPEDPLLLYPRVRTATGIPCFVRPLTRAITKGVFPVPPTVMFPTLITGQGRRRVGQRPTR